LFVHVVFYAVINALLVGVWLLTTGSTVELSHVQDDPVLAVRNGFWPLIVMAAWGGALIIHLGIVIALLLPGGRRSRAKRDRHHHAPPVPPVPPATARPAANGDFGKQAAQAAIGLVETLTGKVESRPSSTAPAAPGRHWVAVMFTDLVGSTSLAERLGDSTWHEVLATHRSLVRRCLDEHHGVEVGTQGDGFLVRFDTPDAAVACATSLQRNMREARARGAFVPELRIGIHAGEAVADDNDLVGRVINLAARVTDAAAGGEILVTEPVADHLSPGVALLDRGLKPLKGFAQPRHLLAVAWNADAGSDETIVLTSELEADDLGS
jgi:class 3 adenylate cyclase